MSYGGGSVCTPSTLTLSPRIILPLTSITLTLTTPKTQYGHGQYGAPPGYHGAGGFAHAQAQRGPPPGADPQYVGWTSAVRAF